MAAEPEESQEYEKLDEVALRRMEDIQIGADPDSKGGTELRYGEDDL